MNTSDYLQAQFNQFQQFQQQQFEQLQRFQEMQAKAWKQGNRGKGGKRDANLNNPQRKIAPRSKKLGTQTQSTNRNSAANFPDRYDSSTLSNFFGVPSSSQSQYGDNNSLEDFLRMLFPGSHSKENNSLPCQDTKPQRHSQQASPSMENDSRGTVTENSSDTLGLHDILRLLSQHTSCNHPQTDERPSEIIPSDDSPRQKDSPKPEQLRGEELLRMLSQLRSQRDNTTKGEGEKKCSLQNNQNSRTSEGNGIKQSAGNSRISQPETTRPTDVPVPPTVMENNQTKTSTEPKNPNEGVKKEVNQESISPQVRALMMLEEYGDTFEAIQQADKPHKTKEAELMQLLLKLDELSCSPIIRPSRKALVSQINAYMEKLNADNSQKEPNETTSETVEHPTSNCESGDEIQVVSEENREEHSSEETHESLQVGVSAPASDTHPEESESEQHAETTEETLNIEEPAPVDDEISTQTETNILDSPSDEEEEKTPDDSTHQVTGTDDLSSEIVPSQEAEISPKEETEAQSYKDEDNLALSESVTPPTQHISNDAHDDKKDSLKKAPRNLEGAQTPVVGEEAICLDDVVIEPVPNDVVEVY